MARRPSDRRRRSGKKTSFRHLRRFRVILRASKDQSPVDLLQAVLDLTRMTKEDALQTMWESYYNGRSELGIAHLEWAELLAERFGERGYVVLLEPVEE